MKTEGEVEQEVIDEMKEEKEISVKRERKKRGTERVKEE